MIRPRPSARAIHDTPAAYSYRRDPAVPKFSDDRPIIIFDGYCALCSGWAQFVLRHDRHAVYRLLRAQSPLGRSLYVHYGLDLEDYQTNILLADGIAWFKSEGSIRMAEGLGWPWSLAGCVRILPQPVRDRLYAFVARNRLRFFAGVPPATFPTRAMKIDFWDDAARTVFCRVPDADVGRGGRWPTSRDHPRC